MDIVYPSHPYSEHRMHTRFLGAQVYDRYRSYCCWTQIDGIDPEILPAGKSEKPLRDGSAALCPCWLPSIRRMEKTFQFAFMLPSRPSVYLPVGCHGIDCLDVIGR